MTDFEVGDLVEVLFTGDNREYYSTGDQGIIVEIDRYTIRVDFSKHSISYLGQGIWYVDPNNLKLIRKGK